MTDVTTGWLSWANAKRACKGGREWVMTHGFTREAYDTCPRGDWLAWLADKLGVPFSVSLSHDLRSMEDWDNLRLPEHKEECPLEEDDEPCRACSLFDDLAIEDVASDLAYLICEAHPDKSAATADLARKYITFDDLLAGWEYAKRCS